jgi:hypothetical protein
VTEAVVPRLTGLRAYALRQLPRVLTQMDRDPGSPTFGGFDRNHWHYKIRDFPSAILQQGVFTLEALRTGRLRPAEPAAFDPVVLERWCVGAVNALGRQVDRAGGVDEYYPFERSFPAAAFALWAAARVMLGWREPAPHLLAAVRREPLARLAAGLARRREKRAMNQQAAAVAALALAERLGLAPEGTAAPHADRLFAAQHPEGWFEEYGGPDFGYLTVTLDALADYHDATGDPRALAAADRAVEFLASLVGADGRLPSTLNSRNTDYVVPYGLCRLGSRGRRASWLVHTLFRDAGEPGHFLWATDDRYHSHYVYASCVRSLEHLDGLSEPEPPPEASEVRYEGCGHWARWAGDRSWTAFVAAGKGGLVRIHRREGPPWVDHGWRLREKGGSEQPPEGRLWASNWWDPDSWSVDWREGSVRLRGACRRVGYTASSPARHLALRLAAALLRHRLVPILKRLMIFRPGGDVGPAFERTVQVDDAGVEVRDRIDLPAGVCAERSPRQNLRHVASADSFSPEELLPGLPGAPERDSAGALRAGWRWDPAGGARQAR